MGGPVFAGGSRVRVYQPREHLLCDMHECCCGYCTKTHTYSPMLKPIQPLELDLMCSCISRSSLPFDTDASPFLATLAHAKGILNPTPRLSPTQLRRDIHLPYLSQATFLASRSADITPPLSPVAACTGRRSLVFFSSVVFSRSLPFFDGHLTCTSRSLILTALGSLAFLVLPALT
ncbi:hypothetical protein VTK56DRAFT_7774 [Thermocarpiscus australiensis]